MRAPRKHILLAAAAALLLACQTLMGGLPATLAPTASPQVIPSLPPAATPDSATATSPAASPTPIVETYDLTREQQQAIFQELWEIIRDQYLYPDFIGLDWDAIHVEYSQRITAGMSDQTYYLAMDEMIYRLGDDHSVFLSPEMVAEEEAAFRTHLRRADLESYFKE